MRTTVLLFLATTVLVACSNDRGSIDDLTDVAPDAAPSVSDAAQPEPDAQRQPDARRQPDVQPLPDATPPPDGGPEPEPVVVMASSITHDGITWTFDGEYATGVFVTGDPWVVGPVEVVSVSPTPTGTRNNSMVDPVPGGQAYDDRGGSFRAGQAANFPLTLQPDSSLVSSISKEEDAETHNLGMLRIQAVLTAVSEPQKPTIFRPTYAAAEKRYFDAGAIRTDVLPKLPAPASAPNTETLAGRFQRPRLDHLSSWTIQHSCAEENWDNGPGRHACYGREYVDLVSHAALTVLLDTPAQMELAQRLIQLGIDNEGVVRAGGDWAANGGHHSGRKWPVVFAARMLDDCGLLAIADADVGTFGEDGHTYFGANGTALFGMSCGSNQTYFQDGCSGSGARDCRDPDRLVDGCSDYRDCCTSSYWVGEALSTRLLEAVDVWNHEPFFEYVDRWMSGDVTNDADAAGTFVQEMWTLYADAAPLGLPVAKTCD